MSKRVNLSMAPKDNFLEVLRFTQENDSESLTEGAVQVLESIDKGEFNGLESFLNEHPEVNGELDEEALEE